MVLSAAGLSLNQFKAARVPSAPRRSGCRESRAGLPSLKVGVADLPTVRRFAQGEGTLMKDQGARPELVCPAGSLRALQAAVDEIGRAHV